MPESQKNSIVHPDSKTKAQTHIKQGLRQKKGIYPGRLGSYRPSGVIQRKVCKGEKTLLFFEGQKKRGGIRDLDGKNSSKKFTVYYQSRAERSIRHLRRAPVLIHCQKLTALHFYLSVITSALGGKKQKSKFDLIGFHLSLRGNKN